MDYEEIHVRQEVREFVRAAEALMSHDSSLTDEEREVLANVIQSGRS